MAVRPTRVRMCVSAWSFAVAVMLAACDGEPALEAPAISFTCPGGTIAPGINQLTINGQARAFYADFPADSSQSLGVIFSWHGFGDTMENHRMIVGLDPDANPALPVIVITPDDSGLVPPNGLDWDIVNGAVEDNVDLQFFEAMLGCLNAQNDIDPTRIYAFGFSAGSVMTSLLHSRYPTLLSAVVAESGAWFNDPAEAALVMGFSVDWTWPNLRPRDQGTVLLTHGGPNDVAVYNVLDLESSAQAAFPFLRAANRTVVDCPHTLGHALNPAITPQVLSAFFSANRGGQPSAYRSPADIEPVFPTSCTLRVP